jgi:L-sorbose 1-phosphate reductase
VKKLETYRKAESPLPDTWYAWQLFGAGLEHVGRDGKPVALELREPADNEILLRVDVLGLCLSDMKIIAQGGEHARLRGRDLANDPTILGHECAATVVKTGKDWQDKFKPGERYIVQADIYYKGVGHAFGYMIPGGLAEYAYLDERALAGDEGCYLLPVKDETGYSQAALAEPWACVEMSYNLDERLTPANDAPLVIADDVQDACRENFPNATVLPSTLEGLDELGDRSFDDIIVRYPTPAIVNAVSGRLNKNGNLWLVDKPAETGDVTIDVGGVHYENKRFLGGGASWKDVGEANSRTDILPRGRALFIGAGGPMGQMHVQRALEKSDGSDLAVVTDLDKSRLEHIENRFGPLAEKRGAKLVTLCPGDYESPDALNEKLRELAPEGYDDVVVLAPVPALVRQAVLLAADNAFVNIFAGIVIGKTAELPLEALCRGIKLIGCSGSRISDLRRVLELVEAGELDSNRSVAAIGGLNAAHEGLKAVKDAVYPGKTVIYTQIRDLPLMPLEEVPEKIPEAGEKLSAEGGWTKEAEAALLEKYL